MMRPGILGLASIFAGLAASMGSATSAMRGLAINLRSTRKVSPRTRSANNAPYTDRTGLSHGRSGDKLKRLAARGTIGLRHGRGPHAGMHLTPRTYRPR